MSDGKKRGGGRPKGTGYPAYKEVLKMAAIAQVLERDNRHKAVRRGIDVIAAFNKDVPNHGLKPLPEIQTIPRRSPKERFEKVAKREWFSVAGENRTVDYLARKLKVPHKKASEYLT